jgi:hypothetical protein
MSNELKRRGGGSIPENTVNGHFFLNVRLLRRSNVNIKDLYVFYKSISFFFLNLFQEHIKTEVSIGRKK